MDKRCKDCLWYLKVGCVSQEATKGEVSIMPTNDDIEIKTNCPHFEKRKYKEVE